MESKQEIRTALDNALNSNLPYTNIAKLVSEDAFIAFEQYVKDLEDGADAFDSFKALDSTVDSIILLNELIRAAQLLAGIETWLDFEIKEPKGFTLCTLNAYDSEVYETELIRMQSRALQKA